MTCCVLRILADIILVERVTLLRSTALVGKHAKADRNMKTPGYFLGIPDAAKKHIVHGTT